jgi:signal transduction histidine kinase
MSRRSGSRSERSSRPYTLRTTFVAVVATLAVAAIVTSAALILFTRVLQTSSATIEEAVESVHLAEEAEVDLLLHSRADDLRIRRSLEANIRRRLSEARRYVSSPGEEQGLDRATREVERYLAVVGDQPQADSSAMDPAYAALEDLVNLNVVQARRSRDQAAATERAANLFGIGVGAAITILTLIALWLLKVRVIRPVAELGAAFSRLRRDRLSRAAESGPVEVREVARQFNTMADALARQEQHKLAFIAGVAHDVRSPLQALHLALGQIDPDRPLPPEPRLRVLVGMVSRQILRLERMMDDLLDTARAEAGQLELRLQSCDVRVVVEDVIQLLEASSAGHRIELTAPLAPVMVQADETRLGQVITNLLQNAIKYSPAGTRIRIAVACRDGEATVAIADEGPGIPGEDQQAVFEPFQRSRAARGSVPGSGLGLFVVKRIVEAHGGQINFKSDAGQGAVIEVSLPVAVDGVSSPPS